MEEFQGRQQRLEKFEQTLDQLREVWRPRLEALAKKFGERVKVHTVGGAGQARSDVSSFRRTWPESICVFRPRRMRTSGKSFSTTICRSSRS